MKKNIFFLIFVFLNIINLAYAIDFTPSGNVNGKGIYKIYNFTNVSAKDFYQNGYRVLDNSTVISASWAGLDFPAGCADGYAVQKINTTLTCVQIASQSSIDALNVSKLNVTDQRYNDSSKIDALNISTSLNDSTLNSKIDALNTSTALNDSGLLNRINNVNTSTNIKTFGFNTTTEIYNYFITLFYGIGNPSNFVNKSQTDGWYFNETEITNMNSSINSKIDALNTSTSTNDTNLNNKINALNTSTSNNDTGLNNRIDVLNTTKLSAAQVNNGTGNITWIAGTGYLNVKNITTSGTLDANLTQFSLIYVNRSQWTSIDNYPTGCGTGAYVKTIGDTLTCEVNNNGTSNLTMTDVATGLSNTTIVRAGTKQCAGQVVQNVTINSSGVFTECYTPSGATYTNGTGLTLVGSQFNVSATACTAGNYSRYNGYGFECYPLGSGTGTVTNVATGTGLIGGPISTTGTINISTAYFDTEYTNKTYADGRYIQLVNEGSLSVSYASTSGNSDTTTSWAGAEQFGATDNGFLMLNTSFGPSADSLEINQSRFDVDYYRKSVIDSMNSTIINKIDALNTSTALNDSGLLNRINSINSSANIESLGFNTTIKLKSYFDTLYGPIANDTFLLNTINALNTSTSLNDSVMNAKINYMNYTMNGNGTINWTRIEVYPAACPAGSAVTQINDTNVCTTFLQTVPYQNSSAGWVNISTSINTTLKTGLNMTCGDDILCARGTIGIYNVSFFETIKDDGILGKRSYLLNGTIESYANGCNMISNSTGLYWVC